MLTTLAVIAGAYLLVGCIMAGRSMRQIYSPDRHRWRRETLGLSTFEAERREHFFRTGFGFLQLFLLAQFAWAIIFAAILWDSWRERQRLKASGLKLPSTSGIPTDATEM